jgi:hypothetical protein
MKKVLIVLSAILCFGLISPYLIVERAYAATQTISLDAQADLMFDDEFGVLDNDDAGRFYAGRDLYGGSHYISRGAMRFNLGEIPGTPIKYELKIHVLEKENNGGENFFLDVWGSANNTMKDTDNIFPTWDNTTKVRKENNEINSGQKLTYDVTSLVGNYTNASDRNITFIITGNETANDSRIKGGLKEEDNRNYHPKLIVTYRINQPPTGSISINSGATYTNVANVTLYLAASDPDGDAMEMRFSNDNTSWGTWEAFNSTKVWALSSGDGIKTVYYQLRDTSKETSAIVTDKITLDTVKPVITGVTNGGFYTTDKTITFNEGTGKLDGNAFISGSIVSTNGPHTIVVTDWASNSTTINFSIDKKGPVVTGVANGMSYNSNRIIFFNEGSATLNGTSFVSGTTITTENHYQLIVTNAAGNSISINFSIDKTKPVVTGVTNGGWYKTDKTITFNEGKAKLDGNSFISGSIVRTVGKHTIVVTDAASNSTTVTFTINKAVANANLKKLIFSHGTLSPVFSSNTLNYTMNVGIKVNKVTVTPTLDNRKATLKVNNALVASGSAVTVRLRVGINNIKVKVKAQDGTIKDYTVRVNRTHPPTPKPKHKK